MEKNVAGQNIGAQMTNKSDGNDFVGTVTVDVTKNNGTKTLGTGSVTNKGGGYFNYAPTQAETNADHLAFTFSGTGALTSTLQLYTNNLLLPIRTNTAQGPGTGSNQIQLDTGASATNGIYDPSMILITAGTGAGQSRNIMQYDGTTKIATVDRNWKVLPDATSVFSIIANSGREHVNEGLAQAGTANTVTLNTLASADDDAYLGQVIFIRSGLGDDQSRLVIAYDGTTKVATVHRDWDTIVNSTSAYVMLPTSSFSSAEIAKAVWDEPLTGSTHNAPTTAGRRLRALSGTILHDGNAQAGSADTIILNTGAVAIDGFYEQAIILITDGTGADQARIISDYTGATRVAGVTPAWITPPDNTSVFDIIPGSVHAATMNGGYLEGNIWIDTINGAAGTLKYVNGTTTRPVSSLADARNLADELNLKAFSINPGSSVIFAQSFDRFEFNGRGYNIDFGNQSAVGARFNNGLITGILSGATGPLLRECRVTNVTIPSITALLNGAIGGTINLNGIGIWNISGNEQAFETQTVINFGANGAQTLRLFGNEGEIEIQNLAAGDIIVMTGDGKVTFNANCTGGTVRVYGVIQKVDNSGGAVTFEEVARLDLDAISANIMSAGDIDGMTLEESQKLISAALAGVLAGAGTTSVTIDAVDGSKTRITATVDALGNRTLVTTDVAG